MRRRAGLSLVPVSHSPLHPRIASSPPTIRQSVIRSTASSTSLTQTTSNPLPDLSVAEQTWGVEIDRILKEKFGLTEFRPLQRAAVLSLLSGNDTIVLLPTGGGKSLCYQLPAVVLAGLTVVVSPLIALMENQTSALKQRGIRVASLNSQCSASERKAIIEELQGVCPTLRLLYVTPEMVRTLTFQKTLIHLYERKILRTIAIDEAHCISSWGHNFRPAYRCLDFFKVSLPLLPVCAVTATATSKVIEDMRTCLRLDHANVFRGTFDRPNIFYEVRYKDVLHNFMEDIREVIRRSAGQSGLIYCAKRETCESVCAELRKSAIECAVYHAKLSAQLRSEVLEKWQIGQIAVVICTIAFGMGIDKPDVRFVIHESLPQTMEGFYQESGRAGRDGLPSRSIVYYSPDDRDRIAFLLQSQQQQQQTSDSDSISSSSSSVAAHHDAIVASFRSLVGFCESDQCRRKQIIQFFDKQMTRVECGEGGCDVCRDPIAVRRCLSLVNRSSFDRSFRSHSRRFAEKGEEEEEREEIEEVVDVCDSFQRFSKLVKRHKYSTEDFDENDESVAAESDSLSFIGGFVKASELRRSKVVEKRTKDSKPSIIEIDSKEPLITTIPTVIHETKGPINCPESTRQICQKMLLDRLKSNMCIDNQTFEEDKLIEIANQLDRECFQECRTVSSYKCAVISKANEIKQQQIHQRDFWMRMGKLRKKKNKNE